MAIDDRDDEAAIPAFQSGGRVRETGIALVHEGEYILPAPGSEAEIEALGTSEGTVNYYFPIEVLVAGTLSEEERDLLEARIFQKLSDALT